jgi:hypothetical protein
MGAFALGIRTVRHDWGNARPAGDTAMRSGPPDHVTSGEAATASKPVAVATALEAVSAFVPGEALGFYITANALLPSQGVRQDIILTMVTLGLSALLVSAPYLGSEPTQRSKRKLVAALVFAVIGGLIYLFALPTSFIHSWSVYTPQVGGIVVIAAAIAMPVLGSLAGLSTPSAMTKENG